MANTLKEWTAMQELLEAIPDADALLALEPEELGAKLLFVLRAYPERT